MKQIIKEGLDYHDLKGQIEPRVSVDEYAAQMGDDSAIVTLTFIVNSKLAAEDLVSWLEIGYDYVIDASVSDGELEPGKWLVFVEMKRRSNVPNKIVDILKDLETLTDRKVDQYEVVVDNKPHKAEVDSLKQAIILSPLEYEGKKQNQEKDEEVENQEGDEELNEMRSIAGLQTKKIYKNIDEEIRKYISGAGL